MPRKAGTGKRSADNLTFKVKRRRLLYGDFAPIAMIIDTMRLGTVIGEKSEGRAKQALRSRAFVFLGEWLCKATPEQLKLLSRWKENPNHLKQPADWLFHLQSAGMRMAKVNETWMDSLRKTPVKQLLNELAAKGIKVDPATLRKGLNSLGIRRPPGRPRKNREVE